MGKAVTQLGQAVGFLATAAQQDLLREIVAILGVFLPGIRRHGPARHRAQDIGTLPHGSHSEVPAARRAVLLPSRYLALPELPEIDAPPAGSGRSRRASQLDLPVRCQSDLGRRPRLPRSSFTRRCTCWVTDTAASSRSSGREWRVEHLPPRRARCSTAARSTRSARSWKSTSRTSSRFSIGSRTERPAARWRMPVSVASGLGGASVEEALAFVFTERATLGARTMPWRRRPESASASQLVPMEFLKTYFRTYWLSDPKDAAALKSKGARPCLPADGGGPAEPRSPQYASNRALGHANAHVPAHITTSGLGQPAPKQYKPPYDKGGIADRRRATGITS